MFRYNTGFSFFSVRITAALAYEYSHHIKREGHSGANDYDRVHDVPNLTQIAAWVKDYPRIYHLQSYVGHHAATFVIHFALVLIR